MFSCFGLREVQGNCGVLVVDGGMSVVRVPWERGVLVSYYLLRWY